MRKVKNILSLCRAGGQEVRAIWMEICMPEMGRWVRYPYCIL